MKKTIKYGMALTIIRNLNELNVFQKSTILSLMFDISKEETIEHLRTGYIDRRKIK